MGNYGIKVLLPGKTIASTEPKDYALNSAYGTVKVYTEPPSKTYQTVNINNGSYTDVSITHGLTFVPLFLLFTELKPGSGHWYMGMGVDDLADPTDEAGAAKIDFTNSYVDSTYIKIRYTNTTGANITIKYYYFIFADNG